MAELAGKNLLKTNQLTKAYGDDCILQDISFALESGKALAITGSSGGGKTTLLSIIGLLQRPSSGTVFVEERNTAELSHEQLAQVRAEVFGFIFQRSRLVHSLTALENVLVPAWLARTGKQMEQRAVELLTQFGLGHRLHYRPQELSLGQLRRVALARALLLSPRILLADEPTNDLDPVLAGEVADRLLQARDSGSGVIIVTHDRELAERCDTILQLRQGKLTENNRTAKE